MGKFEIESIKVNTNSQLIQNLETKQNPKKVFHAVYFNFELQALAGTGDGLFPSLYHSTDRHRALRTGFLSRGVPFIIS